MNGGSAHQVHTCTSTIGLLYDVVNDILNADFILVKFFQYIPEYFR